MANRTSGNLAFVDTAGTLTTRKNVRVHYIIVTTSNATNELALKDPSFSGTLLSLKQPTANVSTNYDFSENPLSFTNGVEVSAATAVNATLVYSIGN
jgi:hypothetical protein